MTYTRLVISVLVMLAASVWLRADDLRYLPQPYPEEAPCLPPPPAFYFSVDFAFLQPKLKGSGGDGEGLSFSPRLDWTVSPRFEVGLTNREGLNPYVGYRGIYSDRGFGTLDPVTDTMFLFSRSTELHAIDFGVRSAPFFLASVLRAEWDLSARLTVTDFRDVYDFDFAGQGFFNARARQQFVGAGPRAGLRVELPIRDTGFSLGWQGDAGVQWGGYRASFEAATFDGADLDVEGDRMAKGGILWHAGVSAALKYSWPSCDPRIVYSLGYQYEAWFGKDLGLLDGGDFGRFDYHGPFVRFEWRF